MQMSVIKLKDAAKYYGDGEYATKALDGVDVEIKSGEFVAIMGPSGSGKSTLMNIIGLLDTPTHGEYEFEGQDVSVMDDKELARIRRKKIGFVFQSFNLLQRHTAIENVALPMVYAKINRFSREARSAELLQKVGLEERIYHYPNELSGGQMQRVAIARSLANNPSLILADEPTGNLDSKSGRSVMELMKELNQEGNTIVMVTHDPLVADYAQRTINLKDGKVESDITVAASTKSDSSTTKSDKNPKTKKSKKKSSSKKKSKSKTTNKKSKKKGGKK